MTRRADNACWTWLLIGLGACASDARTEAGGAAGESAASTAGTGGANAVMSGTAGSGGTNAATGMLDAGSAGGTGGAGGNDGANSELDASASGDAGDGDASVDSDAGAAPRCKRGVGYGYHSMADLEALSPGVHWWYNWAPQPDQGVAQSYASAGVEFVPMVWGGSFDADAIERELVGDAEYLLGFNEPNYHAQSDLTASEAAALWPQLESIADARGLELVSPAVNFCGGGCNEEDPFAYLDAFFAACTDCRVDYVAAHWYACDGPALSWYLGELKKYGKPIWLTEFSCGDGADRSLAVQKQYMQDAVAMLEADDDVYRYAWFAGRTDAIPNVDLLDEDGTLTELGELYVSLPHHDPACAR